jgi:release factor glutamine methyltransferase
MNTATGLAHKVASKRTRFETAPEEMGPPQRERERTVEKQDPAARPEEPPSSGGVSKGARWDYICKAGAKQSEDPPPADTIATLVESGTAALAAAGVPTARLDAEVLLAHACGIDRAALYARWRGAVPCDCRTRFEGLVVRRQRREPLQYIVGHQEFWSLDFVVTPDVLIPRPETELLVELVLAILLEKGDASLRLCDLGTGSGCIAVALASELPRAQVWALDVSEPALGVAQLNARRHGVGGRIHFVAGDGFSAVKGLRLDAIICNPPYVSSRELRRAQPELAWEPRQALDGGPTALAVIERIVAEAPGYLRERGWLLMEMGADQCTAVEQLARTAGFSSVSVRTDYAGLPRVLVARR